LKNALVAGKKTEKRRGAKQPGPRGVCGQQSGFISVYINHITLSHYNLQAGNTGRVYVSGGTITGYASDAVNGNVVKGDSV
jgi:hypothetical protein